MSNTELAWNELGVARSTHFEYPTRSYTLSAPSPDRASHSDSPFRASSWPRTRSPPEDRSPMGYFPPARYSGSSNRDSSLSRSSRGEDSRPLPIRRDSSDSTRSSSSRPPTRTKFFRDYQECKMRTLEAEYAEEQYGLSVKPASKLSRKELKERQANPKVFNGTPLATREFHEKAAELAEIAADAFHDAIKSHRLMVEHYKTRNDKEKLDWHKTIIEKFSSKENTMNNNYSQHMTSHTDPRTVRGFVNAKPEASNVIPLMSKRPRLTTKSVGFDLPGSRSRYASHPSIATAALSHYAHSHSGHSDEEAVYSSSSSDSDVSDSAVVDEELYEPEAVMLDNEKRRSRSLTRNGSFRRTVSPKSRLSFYDEWDKNKLQKGVKKIGDTGRGSMGRAGLTAVLPYVCLLVSLAA